MRQEFFILPTVWFKGNFPPWILGIFRFVAITYFIFFFIKANLKQLKRFLKTTQNLKQPYVLQSNLNKNIFLPKTRLPPLILLIGCAAGLKRLIGRWCQNCFFNRYSCTLMCENSKGTSSFDFINFWWNCINPWYQKRILEKNSRNGVVDPWFKNYRNFFHRIYGIFLEKYFPKIVLWKTIVTKYPKFIGDIATLNF